jgi:hypothetical protein
MTKTAGSGSISQRHGSADPDPYQKMSWIRNTAVYLYELLPGLGNSCRTEFLPLLRPVFAHQDIFVLQNKGVVEQRT